MYFYFICLWPGTVPTEGDEFKVLIPDVQAGNVLSARFKNKRRLLLN
jgi:hypothetical protein